MKWWQKWIRYLAAGYLLILLYSHLVRWRQPADDGSKSCCAAMVRSIDGKQVLDSTIRLAYLDLPSSKSGLPLILLHGSPGDANVFRKFAELLPNHRRIIPDLPGFGHSTRDIPDYSFKTHAKYVLELLDQLRIEKSHVVGFSLGGGVALEMAEMAPQRVASITMLSSIGVQEMELLGDYHLNHALHGMQLGFLWLLREGLPLTPTAYNRDISVAYARNFYDSDQRPLGDLLKTYAGPMLIIHGKRDFLVPVEAAIEHHRLVPQSELVISDDDHFMTFMKPENPARYVAGFVDRVETGKAVTRSTADSGRVAASEQPLDPRNLPRFIGLTAVVVVLLLAAATLVSEDLTCITAGMMAAQGRIGFLLASFACFLGIFVGDLLLFLAGRWLGRPALQRAPIRWFIRDEDVRKSSDWFGRRGAGIVLASRFLPGARLPTYFAAGALRTSLWKFALYFFLACVIWTPALVGLAMLLGREVVESALVGGQSLLVKVSISAIPILIFFRLLVRLSTWKGRRLLISSWRRTIHWEFWSPFVFYTPIVFYIGWLMLKYRSMTLFTAANPAIPGGGFIGESKADILYGLSGSQEFLPKWELIESVLDVEARYEQATAFLGKHNLSFPVVLKPNAGQRGSGVLIAKSKQEVKDYLTNAAVDMLIQEFFDGEEFGVFYYRYPREDRGRIFAVTEKRFPVVIGDGQSRLEELILNDPRAVCMARFLLDKHAGHLWEVPARGEQVRLVDIGTHSRGAIFLDGEWVKTEEMENAVDRICNDYNGFFFGRFDIRTPNIEDFKLGQNFKIIELNGVTSEATSIYDPKNSVFTAYRILYEQWRIAFEIGAQNRMLGAQMTPVRELIRELINYRGRSATQV